MLYDVTFTDPDRGQNIERVFAADDAVAARGAAQRFAAFQSTERAFGPLGLRVAPIVLVITRISPHRGPHPLAFHSWIGTIVRGGPGTQRARHTARRRFFRIDWSDGTSRRTDQKTYLRFRARYATLPHLADDLRDAAF